jgi:hypothetical protein
VQNFQFVSKITRPPKKPVLTSTNGHDTAPHSVLSRLSDVFAPPWDSDPNSGRSLEISRFPTRLCFPVVEVRVAIPSRLTSSTEPPTRLFWESSKAHGAEQYTVLDEEGVHETSGVSFGGLRCWLRACSPQRMHLRKAVTRVPPVKSQINRSKISAAAAPIASGRFLPGSRARWVARTSALMRWQTPSLRGRASRSILA